MRTVRELAGWLEGFAPSRLAESWDNVGLLWGDPDAEVERVMTCLTVSGTTADEAVDEQANVIVSHHPVLFRGVKQIRADLPTTAHLWTLARSGIAILSPHTSFDSTSGGINDGLCRRLGLTDVTFLRAIASPASYKIVVFTPESDREAVLAGAFEAGAGRIGAYEECSFALAGQGTFFGTEETNPSVGQKGRRETVQELRLEIVCPGARLSAVLAAIRARHSYEEPAI
ncbi:MAG: Nif3-like dinuclear metal center hexameric protein, partial [Isosphaeraceae bacterium]